MPTVRLHMTSALSAPELMAVLTDFSPARPNVWPTIDNDPFEVHAVGDTWAEVTEGTAYGGGSSNSPRKLRAPGSTPNSFAAPRRSRDDSWPPCCPLVAPAALKKWLAGPSQAK